MASPRGRVSDGCLVMTSPFPASWAAGVAFRSARRRTDILNIEQRDDWSSPSRQWLGVEAWLHVWEDAIESIRGRPAVPRIWTNTGCSRTIV